jgi:hypothetical protein
MAVLLSHHVTIFMTLLIAVNSIVTESDEQLHAENLVLRNTPKSLKSLFTETQTQTEITEPMDSYAT